jgi:hypothetical protein
MKCVCREHMLFDPSQKSQDDISDTDEHLELLMQ